MTLTEALKILKDKKSEQRKQALIVINEYMERISRINHEMNKALTELNNALMNSNSFEETNNVQ